MTGRHEASPGPLRTAGRYAGTAALARLHTRTHRWALVGWPLVIAALVVSTAAGIVALYPSEAARQGYAASIGISTASIAANGRGYDLTTPGGIVAYELGFYVLLIFPAIAIHLAVRLTRGEEEAGREELLTAARVGRLAPLAAGALVVSASLLLAGLASGVGLVAAGLPAAGSARYAAGLTLALLTCAGLGLGTAQLSWSGRTALTLGLGVVLVAYLARGVVDGRGWSAVWLNPSGWLAETRTYGQGRLWPYLAYAVLAALLVASAARLRTSRDLGAGLLAARPGPARAARQLGTVAGLTWRLLRGAVLGWAAVAVVMGAAFGVLAPEMQQVIRSNPTLAEFLGGSGRDPVDLLIVLCALFAALAAAGLAVQGAARLTTEERSGRTGLTVATRIGRRQVVRNTSVVLVAAVLGVLAAGGLSVGVTMAISVGDGEVLGTAARAAAAYAPGVLLLLAGALALWGLRPWLSAAGWLVLGWGCVVAILGDTLRLPSWARGLSPLWHTGRVPLEDPSATALLVMSGLAAVLWLAAVALFGRRDLRAG